MEFHPVKSSNIKAVGYDVDAQRLVVQFHSDKKYVFADVPPQVYCNFLDAKSMGIYFVRNIKGKYGTEKL